MKNLSLIVIAALMLALSGSRLATLTKAQNSAIQPAQFQPDRQETFDKLIESARQTGSIHVIIGLETDFIPEGNLSAAQAFRQRLDIKKAQTDFLGRFQSFRLANVKLFDYIPYMAFETDAETLVRMRAEPAVTSIQEDEISQPALAESTPIVGAQTAWISGYTGNGQTVAILDTGVDKNHTFLSGKVVSEACYSSNNASSTSVCPGGATESTAVDSGLNCPTDVNGCAHGTHVAGIAAGNGTSFSGVAKDANIVAIQVFSRFSSAANCGSTPAPCALYWTSDLIKGLERVRTLANTMNNIAAVNLSLQTGQQFTGNCDAAHAPTKAAIDNLRSVGIPTVICAGNFAFTNALTAPACISTSISVGSTDDGSFGTTLDTVSNFSDSSPLLHLLAPGRWINSSVPGNAFSNFSGTSMATPHVVGAFAILKQRNPNATIPRILNALIATGQPITDSRNGLVKPRIRIGLALQLVSKTTPFDFDGDGKTDISVFRPSSGEWWISSSLTNQTGALQFGTSTDKITPSDFTGDGRTDVALFRPSNGSWFVLRSEDNTFFSFPFGTSGDVPVVGDFDGDGRSDTGVFRPSSTTWFISRSSGGILIQPFGAAGDVPVPGDYDGDGKTDIAIYRPASGEWWINRSGSGVVAFQFGASADKPVQGDYTGDGRTDAAFFRPSTGFWYILRSEDSSFFAFPFGTSGDTPAPGDYDGDAKFDPAVFRSSSTTWFVQRSTAGTQIVNFGAPGDLPVPNAYVP